MKTELFEYIDTIQDDLIGMANTIFDNPELGLKEYKASEMLCKYLEDNGFNVEKGIGGYETAFKAVYENGEGGPSIGLLCEYDALENIGHACGHHMQGPAILGAATTVKEKLKDENYKIVVYGTPAEETIGGKIYMLREGCFKDIDVALMMHGGPETTVDVKSLALSKFTVNFKGKKAHAAVAPDQGRSAFDGLLLAFQGLEFLREHVKDDVRIHYTVLSAGGTAANVVPDNASGSFYVRSYDREHLDDVVRRFKNIMKGAALMSDIEYEIITEKEMDNKIPVYSLNDTVMENANLVEAPNITPPREKTGSTDFGSVMYQVPGTCIRVTFVDPGTSSHSDEYLKEGKTERAHNAIVTGAKVLAATSYDLIKDEKLMNEIKEEFEMRKNKRAN